MNIQNYAVNKKIERINDASVLDVELSTEKLTVWRKKHEPGRVVDVLTTFIVVKNAQVRDINGNITYLSRLKPGSRVTVDYVKESSGRLVASNIIVTPKQRRGGEGGWLK